jgi:hypothetical protein
VVVVGQLVENEGGEEVNLGLLERGRLGHEETEPDLRCGVVLVCVCRVCRVVMCAVRVVRCAPRSWG